MRRSRGSLRFEPVVADVLAVVFPLVDGAVLLVDRAAKPATASTTAMAAPTKAVGRRVPRRLRWRRVRRDVRAGEKRTAWSLPTLAGHTSQVNLPLVPDDDLRQRLARLLGGEIEGLRRLTGGASRETWSFLLAASDGPRTPLILRRDPPGRTMSEGRHGGMPMEARVLRAAKAAGMPVPTVIADGPADSEVLETGFIVMEHVDGETIARKILRDEPYAHARSVVVRQLGAAIAPLHAVDPASVEGLAFVEPLAYYRQALDDFGYPSPAFELGFRWLEANRPAVARRTIVHGDYRFGNVIIGEAGLAAVIDWELCHLGDPMEDLGWLGVRAWRFGGRGEIAGMGTVEELLEGYRSAGGVGDADAVRWWMVAGTLIWGVMCIGQAEAHLGGARSVELAAIGRRVAEQEHDLLVMLGFPASAEDMARPVGGVFGGSYGPHGLPTAALLAEAVREFLERDVMTSATGRVQFHARVAANVMGTIERELLEGPAAVDALRADHRSLDVADERSLVDAIRFGGLDDRYDEVCAAVRRSVTARLRIANPRHFADRS